MTKGASARLADRPEEKISADQRLRIRRLGMSGLSYLVTFTIVSFCWYVGLVPGSAVLAYALIALTINGLFLVAFRTGLNLRFSDPSLTAPQMVLSLLPAVYVMYFLDEGQARAVFLMIAIVPGLYGILALNTRRFLMVVGWFFAIYGAVMALIWWHRPEVIVGSLEFIQMVAFVLVLGEMAVIGGYISGLRGTLRRRNQELGEALERISEMASRDELTGTFNRRHLFEMLKREINRYNRAQGPFCLCIMDLDYFKEVNDTYGHQAGDEVLRALAKTIQADLRNIDCFGRYGGEEFLLILPQTPIEGAEIKAERVRGAVEALRFPGIGENFGVTVSIGVSQFHQGETVDDTIARADQALYLAKDRGRNQSVSERDPEIQPRHQPGEVLEALRDSLSPGDTE